VQKAATTKKRKITIELPGRVDHFQDHELEVFLLYVESMLAICFIVRNSELNSGNRKLRNIIRTGISSPAQVTIKNVNESGNHGCYATQNMITAAGVTIPPLFPVKLFLNA